MRDNLNGFSQIITTAFFVDYALINTSCSNVVSFGSLDTEEAFVVSKVEVCFMTVNCYIAFSVFVRVKSTRVNINVRVELLNSYAVASCLQQFTY